MRRKITASLLALLLISMVTLSACGGDGAASDDPNLGIWNATTGEMMGLSMDVSDFFGAGFIIELKAGGKCALTVDGEKANGTWTLEDGAFTVSGGGFDGSGTLANGLLILDDVMGMGLTLTFEKEGGYAAAPTAATPTAEEGSLDDYDYHPEHVTAFEGDWFGVIYFDTAFGMWSGLEGERALAVARFAFRNGECEPYILMDLPAGDAYLSFKDIKATIGTNGLAINGSFYNLPFENTLTRASENEPAILYLYTDEEGDGFDATLYLRPWGESWSDSDPWMPLEEDVLFVGQSAFEDIALLLNGDGSEIPAPTNIAGMGRSYGGSGGKSPQPPGDEEGESTAMVDSAIVGIWVGEGEGGSYSYEFREDATGVIEAAGERIEFTYEDTGSELSIAYLMMPDTPLEVEYSLDGDTLTVIDVSGFVNTLTRSYE